MPDRGSRGLLAASLLAAGVAVAFADASIVVLALPAIYGEFDVSIVGVSWVITIYAVTVSVVAGAMRAAVSPRSNLPLPPRLLTTAGLVLFAATSLACGFSTTLASLLAARVGQGAGAGLLLVGALPVLESFLPPGRGHRVWATAALGGLAIGPALGGVLTEAFDWQAIFLVQAPIAALGLVASLGRQPAGRAVTAELPGQVAIDLDSHRTISADEEAASAPARSRHDLGAVRGRRSAASTDAVLANLTAVFVSGAMVGALFLAVLLVIEVWRYSPAQGALSVSTLPAGALLARWFAGRTGVGLRLGSGLPLVAIGLVGVALLPATDPWLLAAALALCGTGLGLALDVVDPISIRDELSLVGSTAASVLARHAGLVLGLLVIAPVLSDSLDTGAERAALAGTQTVLEADLDVRAKLDVARRLRDTVAATPKGEMPDLVRAVLGDAGVDRREASDEHEVLAADLTERVEGVLTRQFRTSFGLGALLAVAGLVPGLALLGRRPDGDAGDDDRPYEKLHGTNPGRTNPSTGLRPRQPASLAAKVVAGLAIVAGAGLVAGELAAGAADYGSYDPADPCTAPAETFGGGGLDGVLQRIALGALNGAACELDVSREELVLSLDQSSSLAVVHFDDDTLERALEAGALRAVDDAQERGSLPGPLAAVIRQTIRFAPIGWLAEQLDIQLD